MRLCVLAGGLLYALPGPASLKRPEGSPLGPILMLARGCAARRESRSGCRPSILNLSKKCAGPDKSCCS